MKSSLRQQRSESWEALEVNLGYVADGIVKIRPKLAELRGKRTYATAENRSFYRDQLAELARDANAALVRWDVLCALYDIIGDTKERAW